MVISINVTNNKETIMKLSIYNIATHGSAIDAMACGAIYDIAQLDESEVTQEMMDDAGCRMSPWFWNMIDASLKTLVCVGNRDDFRYLICTDDGIPQFECDYDGGNEAWVKLDALEIKNNVDIKRLEDSGFTVTAFPIDCGDHTKIRVIIKDSNGQVLTDVTGNDHDEFDVVINGHTFDFRIHDDSLENRVYLDFYNLVNNRTNYEFEYSRSAEMVDATFILCHDIHNELLNIEKWAGEAYCGPNVNGAGPEGDEIYKALHAIRKRIGIGYKEYDESVKNAE